MATKRKSSKRNSKNKAPWDKPAPKRSTHTRLTAAEKRSAKKSAQKAGRPYPNLVDNMRVVKSEKKKRS